MTSKDHVKLVWNGTTVYVDVDARRVWMGGDYTEVTREMAAPILDGLVKRARKKLLLS